MCMDTLPNARERVHSICEVPKGVLFLNFVGNYAALVTMLARLPDKQKVLCSTPGRGSSECKYKYIENRTLIQNFCRYYGRVA
jgi:hypothetical protein